MRGGPTHPTHPEAAKGRLSRLLYLEICHKEQCLRSMTMAAWS